MLSGSTDMISRESQMAALTESEKYISNLKYTLRLLKDKNYTREEIIAEFESHLAHAERCHKAEHPDQ